MGRERRFDALFDRKERQRIFHVDPVRVAHRDADLTDPPQTFFDQALVAGMERLITADEQGRRLCGSNAGRSRASACSAQNCGVPSAPNPKIESLRRRQTSGWCPRSGRRRCGRAKW